MADTGWFEASGSGETIVAGGAVVAPTIILAHLGTLTSMRVRVVPGGDPQRLQFAGSVGWGGSDLDHTSTLVNEYVHGYQLEFERNAFLAGALQGGFTQAYADRLWWKLPPGITWWLMGIWA